VVDLSDHISIKIPHRIVQRALKGSGCSAYVNRW